MNNIYIPRFYCKKYPFRFVYKFSLTFTFPHFLLKKKNVDVFLLSSAVRSFGTEDRPTDRPVAPRDEVYEYIIFRGSDIKDIHICQPPKPQPTLQGGLPNDPAIVQVRTEFGARMWEWDIIKKKKIFLFSSTLLPAVLPPRPVRGGISPAAAVAPEEGPSSSRRRPEDSSSRDSSSSKGEGARRASVPSAPAPPWAGPDPTPLPPLASLRLAA